MIYVILVFAIVAASVVAGFAVRGARRSRRLLQAPQERSLPASDTHAQQASSAPVARRAPAPPPASPPEQAVVTPAHSPMAAAAEGAPTARTSAVEATPSRPAPAKHDLAGLRKGLSTTRGGFIAKLASVFQGKKQIDPAILERVEEIMLASDVGPTTTQVIVDRLRSELDRDALRDETAIWAALRAEAVRILSVGAGPIRTSTSPTVVLVVGVNGTGKTTTIGKLAMRFRAAGKTVLLAAGDTFRAAAVQQLEVWATRVGADVVKGKDGADPSAVAFDATTRAREQRADVLLIDTAGRLHTRSPLMDEIKKLRKTIAKASEGAPHETLLVLDATTGQNAITQAAMFREAIDVTGIVLTKLDGTAKGGIILAVCNELKVPVRYIGLGERADDLREFVPEDFADALFGKPEEDVVAA